MLPLALLLFGHALVRYLWMVKHLGLAIAGVMVAFTLLGATSYVPLALTATLRCQAYTPRYDTRDIECTILRVGTPSKQQLDFRRISIRVQC
jgi:hypothetical protein